MALRLLRLLPLVFIIACSSSVTNKPSEPVDGSSGSGTSLHGSLFGGKQPVANAKVQLFAVGTTGDGSPSTALLNTAATTDSNGNFITGTYTCPSSDPLVYITGTGGNPGVGSGNNNSALALMAALGRCGDLSANTSIVVNEITTVAAASALAPFATSGSSIGSSVADAASLAAAFVQAAEFANTSTGSAPGAATPDGTAAPVEMINTVADILASCVDSAGGVAGDLSNCGILFSLSDPNRTAPATDTITAALHILTYSTLHPSALFNRMPADAPYQPVLSAAPSSFAVNLSILSGLQPSLSRLALTTPAVGTSSTQALKLTNTSKAPIALSSFSITGLNGAEFSQTNTCPASLPVSADCTVSLSFAPTASGNRIASLSIGNDTHNSPLIIPLSGIVIPVTPIPQIVSVSPSSLPAGSSSTTLTITGSGFSSSSTVLVNGLMQSTTYISPQSLSFTLTDAQLSNPGSLAINVRNGGNQSSSYFFSVTNPMPTLTSISPSAITAGSPRFTLTVSGTGIFSQSAVLINGISHTVSTNGTTYVVSVDSSEIANVGDLSVTVANPAPGGGTSAALLLHVIGAGNRLRTLDYPTNDIVHDEIHHLLYASVASPSATSPNSIIAVDPLHGTVVATQAMTGEPAKLAIADDASYLYVSLPATGEISRLRLPSLTPDLQWSLKNSSGVGYSAVDMAVAPGQPHTLAVTGSSLNIYDDSTRRSLSPTPGYPLPTFDTIAWGSDATVLYATSAVMSTGPEYTFSVDQNGPTLTKTTTSVFGDFVRRLVYDKSTNRIYDGYGSVADPATGIPAGQLDVHNTLTYEQNPFAIDSAHNKAFFLNVNAFLSTQGIDIQAFDLTSFDYINAITTQNLSGSKIVTWGSSGVAIGGGSKIYLIDGSFVSSAGTSSQTGSYLGVSPTLNTISPQTVAVGSGSIDITLNGRDFSESSIVTWNNQTLPTSSQTATKIVATIPSSLLAKPITTPVTVSNGPGTESSEGVSFAVLPDLGPNLQISAISISGQDMAWDATRGRLYVAMTDGPAGSSDSLGVVDPATTTLAKIIFTGGRPTSLGLSDDGHYLYAGFQTANFVKRFALPDFSLDLTIPLNSGSLMESHAEDVKVAPGNPHTVAIAMGSYGITPRGAGGLAVFDDAVQRQTKFSSDVYKVAWGKDSTQLFAQSDSSISSQALYIFSADSNGIVEQAASGGITTLGLRPHYDSATNLIYGDGGRVSDPAAASAAGIFQARGLMVPDAKLNRAFVLRQNTNLGPTVYELDVFDLARQTLLKTIQVPAVSGYPTQLVRWGSQGLAFLTEGQAYNNATGMLYILQGSDITGANTPPPGSITLNPAAVIAGASSLATITVDGTGFQQTSTVLVNGTARPTTYISPTQLSFQLSAADQSFASYLAVVVTDPVTGISSPASGLSVSNPVPLISSLSSAKLPVGSPDTQVMLSGEGFVPTTGVLFNGKARSATYIAPNQVSVALPHSDFGTAGSYTLTAINPTPGGGTSSAALEIDNPLPTITSVSPTTVQTGSSAKTIIVSGTGFVRGTVVQVNGTPRLTTYSAPSYVSVSLTAADFASQGSISIIAVNPAPGGGSSAAASIAVNNALLGPITLTPSTVTQGASTPVTITVTGSNFTPDAYVLVSNSQRPTTYISSTQLSFSLTVADQASVATKVVTVVNSPPNGPSSSAFLKVAAATATPVISSIYPTQFVTNTADAFLSISGAGFNSSSVVRWNGNPLVTYFGGASIVSASVPSSLLASPGTASITVETATSTPPDSNAVSVNIVLPASPAITKISPSYGPIHTGFTTTVTGTDFTANSTVTFNGAAIPTTFVSSTQLTATVPDSAVLPGNSNIVVTTPAPGGGTSGALVYTAYIPIANNSMLYNSVDRLFYLSVPGSAGAPYANSIVSLDPLTGALGTPIFVGSEPNHLALTSDGKSLWVGLDGANAVRKVDLVAHTAGLQFSFPNPSSSFGGALKPVALVAVPGETNSVIVSAIDDQPFNSVLALYDNGVQRGSASYFAASSIAIDGSKNEVYAAQNGGYQTFTYGSSGLTHLATGNPDSTAFIGYDDRLQLSSSSIYTESGKVLKAETAATLGTFDPTTSTPVSTTIDPALGLAFALDASTQYSSLPTRIQVFKLSDFTPVSSDVIPVNLASTNGYSPNTPVSKLTRWGSNGLAFRDGTSVYALRSNLVKDLTASPADLGVTLNVSGTTITGAKTTYTATITNAGPQTASEIILSGLAPSTGVLTSAISASGTCAITTDAVCNLGTLASGASASVVFTIDQLTPGSSIFTVEVTASQPDPDQTNNQSSSTTTITGDVYNPSPAVTSISPSAILAGSGDTVVTVNGSGFTVGSTIMLDGKPLSTTAIDSSGLSAMVPASSISTLGWHLMTVSNPTPGGGLSSAATLTVYSAIKAGANHIIYDPFSRKIIASLGSTQPLGNSIATLTPENGELDTPNLVGSEPTRMELSDDGNFLYVLASGEDQIVRYNMRTQQPEFSFKLPTISGTYTTATTLFAIQPGSEDTLAVNTPNGPAGEIVDFDPIKKQATARQSTVTFAAAGGEPHFLDASTLIFASRMSRYTVTPSGLGPLISSIPIEGSAFKIAKGVAYSSSGNIVDVTTVMTKKLGTFVVQPPYYGSQADSVAPDPSIGRVFFNADFSNNTYNVLGGSGVVAFDANTLVATQYTPFAIDPSTSVTPVNGVDLIRWGQDGLASLNTNGTIYLMRGPAVLSQLLGTSTPPVLAGPSQAVQHGSGNIVITLNGSNFLPGIAAFWNGSYRTTTLIDSTHVTMDVPYSDLLSSGTIAITCSNPGSTTSAPVAIEIN